MNQPRGALDLHLPPLPAGRGRSAGLQDALRRAIRTGGLATGTPLPSTRALAADLGWARGTVVDAYDQLAAEGWLVTHQGALTTVAPVPPIHVSRPVDPSVEVEPRHDLRPGRPEAGSFPRQAWSRALRAAVADAPDGTWESTPALGLPVLRRALAGYMGRTRGVTTHADHVVITAGFSGVVDLVAPVLRPGPVAVEPRTLDGLSAILGRHGHPVVRLGADSAGAAVGELDAMAEPPVAVLVTPAHQWPLGGALSADRRHALLSWARAHDALVVEDDYDGEFRFDRQPVGAIQSLDPESVVYGGTASKTLGPGLRLGWMVAPERVVEAVGAMLALPPVTTRASVTDQLALAEMIRTGAYDRHVRRMRQRYRRRRDHLVATLADRTPGVVVTGVAAGLHAALLLPDGTDQGAVRAALAWHGVGVAPLPDVLVVGYATPAGHAFVAAVSALVAALESVGLGVSPS